MQTVVHVTHEAIQKIGGIGAVLHGLLTSRVYLDQVQRNILVGPFWPTDERGDQRLGPQGEVLYSSLDSLYRSPLAARFREIDHGHWEGMVHKDVEKKYAGEYVAWSADPLTIAPPGGETAISVLARALPAMRRIVTDHQGQTILIASHKATNRLLIAYYLGMDVRRYRDRLGQDVACLNILDFSSPTEARVVTLNDTAHYAS